MSAGDVFDIDPGKAPRGDKEPPESETADADGRETLPPPEPEPEPQLELLEWTPQTVGGVLDAGALIPNGLTRMRGGGPEDVYLFTDDDHKALDPAIARYLNRHERLRQLAAGGDLLAIFIGLGQYAVRETGRAALYREQQEEGSEDLREQTAAGMGTRVKGEPEIREPRRPFDQIDEQ